MFIKHLTYVRSQDYYDLLLPKLGLRMKLFILFSFVILFQINAAESYAQKTKLSFEVESASIVEVLDKIQTVSGFKFFYSEEDLDLSLKFSMKVKDKLIYEVLDEILETSEATYEIVESQVVIKKLKQTDLFITQPPTIIQQAKVTGKVRDGRGSEIPGATVVVKGTRNGTSTDLDGNFQIYAASTDTLLVSSIGFKTKIVAIGGRSVVDVVLEESTTNLGEVEVVATGLFTRDKKSYTGSVTTVTRGELMKMNNQNVLSGLANIDPSFVRIEDLSAGSNPNVVPNYQMRGTSAISKNLQSEYADDPNQPLFILDGFETTITKIRDLDVNLIEKITLLKDATAKAVYGSRGANGVVVVETRRPEAGKLRVTYAGSMSLEMPDLSSYDLANASEKLEIERMAGLYTSDDFESQMTLDGYYSEKRLEVENGVNTDWLAQAVRTGVGQRHSLFIDGGENEVLYGFELSYNDIMGAMKGSGRKTFTGGVTLTYRKDNLLFRNRLAVVQNNSTDSPYGSFSDYAAMNPYLRLVDEDGETPQMYTFNGLEIANPLWNAGINTKYLSGYTDITENLYGEWTIATGLKMVGRLGITNRKTTQDIFKPAAHTDFLSVDDVYSKGSYTKTNGNNLYASGNLGLSYAVIMGKHTLMTNGQVNFSTINSDLVSQQAEGFPNDKMNHIIFAIQYQDGGKPYGSESISHSAGGLLSFNYSYDEKYLVDVNYRMSGSSEYGANQRWGSFWSAGAGWNLHNESFLQNNHIISMLKIRGSLGYTGSQGFNTYEALSTVRYYTSSTYRGNIGSYLVSMANPNLKWQSKYDKSVGADFSLFRNVISGRFDYYVSDTESMLTDVTLPVSTGFTYYRENLGKTQNKGVEANLNVKLYQKPGSRDFINFYANASHNKNTLKQISNGLKAFNDAQDESKSQDESEETYADITSPSVRYIEGQSINAIWAVRSLGIDPQNGQEIFLKKDGSVTYDWDAADQVVAGNLLPTVTGNVGLSGEFHNFGWNLALYYRLGGQVYNSTLVDKVENANLSNNVDRRVFTDRWQQEGDIARFKSITNTSYTRPTTRFVEDNNTLTLSSVNVYYDFRDTRFVKSSFVERFRVSVNLNDIFVISSVNVERGTSYPYARNATFSISATF